MKKIATLFASLLLLIGCAKQEEVEIIEDEPIETEAPYIDYAEVVSYSCYDYIMDTMSEPQYYSDWTPYYNYDYYEINAKEAMPNGTAWNYDEETETFYRGYTKLLRLDFLNNKAYREDAVYASSFQPQDIVTSKYEVTEVLDFNNRTIEIDGEYSDKTLDVYTEFYVVDDEGYCIVGEDGNYEFYPYSYFFENDIQSFREEHPNYLDGEYRTILVDTNYHVEKMMYKYNKKFEQAGCPLINQPQGTMENYKYAQAHLENVIEEEKTYKYTSPWELDGYDWDPAKSNTPWLENMADIYDVEVPYSEPEEVIYSHDDKETGESIVDLRVLEYRKSPVFLIFIEPDAAENLYINKINHHTKAIIINQYWEYYIYLSGFSAYVLSPLMEELYGHDAVFFCDYDKVGSYDYDNSEMYNPTKSMIINGERFNWNQYSSCGEGLEIYPLNTDDEDRYISCLGRDENTYLFLEIMDLYSYYGKEMPCDDDYLFKLHCLYDYETQTDLGLW